MTEYEIASLAISLGIGLGQIGIVWYGIRAMNRASAARDRAMQQRDAQAQRDAQQRDADSRRRHAETLHTADQRHTETMTALQALIARTAPAAR